MDTSKARLPGLSGHTCGASDSSAATASIAWGSAVQSISIASAPSLGCLDRIGDHECNGVAHMTHFLAGKDEIGRRLRVGTQRAREARQRPQIGNIVAGEDEAHAGYLTGGCGIDRKTRMGMGRAHHHGMESAVHDHIGDVAALAAQQRDVLAASHRLGHAEFRLGHRASVRSTARVLFRM